MDDNDSIAVLLSGYDDEGRPLATVVLRDSRGHLSLRDVGSRAPAMTARRPRAPGVDGQPALLPASAGT
jgi:hypothetical protein